MLRRCFALVFFSFNISLYVAGQNLEQYEKYALGAYHSKNYSTALRFSELALEVDSTNATSLFIAGEASKNMGNLEQAEMYLERIPDNAKIGYMSASDFELAKVKIDLKKYDEAIFYLKRYLEANKASDDYLTQLALKELESLKGMSEEEKAAFLFRITPLADNINSEYTDIAPLRYADKIYFSSAFKADEKANPVSRLFEAIRHYPARLVPANPKDGSLNASNIALMPDGRKMFYTLCKDTDYRSQKDCTIWSREKTYEGSWGPPVKLPPHINLKGYTTTQPAIGWDKNLRKFVLYFSTNRPGGIGKMDIWAATFDSDGTFGQPFLLPINTLEDEVTPYYHLASETLFFSSDGWPGLGGLDIFQTSNESGTWTKPENLGDLINSSYNDYYYTFHSSSGNAYFSSNRPNASKQLSRGDEDIFSAHIFVDVKVRAFSMEESALLKSPSVFVEDLTTQTTGSFNSRPDQTELVVRLEAGKSYRLVVSAEGYEPAVTIVNTLRYSYISELKKNLYLKSKIKP